MSNSPLVSVIVPIYNASLYLRQTLDCICNQTLRNIEIILVDDGSTDSTLSILQEYAAKDARIVLLQQNHEYAGAARNKGMAIARGKYYSFLDADDLFESTMLEKMVERAEETCADMVLIKADTFWTEGNFSPMPYQLKDLYPAGVNKYAFNVASEMPQMLVAFQPWAWDKLFRAEYIKSLKLSFGSTHRVNDILFVYPATAFARIVSIIDDEVLAHYRRSETQLSSSAAMYRDVSCMVVNAKQAYDKMCQLGANGDIFTVFCCRLAGSLAWTFTQVYGETRNQLLHAIRELESECKLLTHVKLASECDKFSDMLRVIREGIHLYTAINETEKYDLIIDDESTKYQIKPKISVVLPIYNAEPYLREALDSLLSQSYRHMEIICVNDGSIDNSLEIIEEYAARDSRFVVLDGPNGGYGKAMNRGMAVASGKYLAILEPDDVLPEKAYEILVALSEKHDLDIAKGCVSRFMGERENRVYYETTSMPAHFLNRTITPREELQVYSINMNTWTCLYRLDLLRNNNLVHNESPGASYQDNGLFFLSFSYAERMMCVNDVVYHCRRDNVHSSVYAMANKPFAMRDEYAYIRKKMIQDSPEIWEKVKPAYLKKRLDNHLFTYTNIRDSFKLEYLDDFRKELIELEDYDRWLLSSKYREQMKFILQSPMIFMLSEILVSPPQQKKGHAIKKEHRGRFKSLFYKKSKSCTSYKFFGLPIYSKRKKHGRKLYKIFGIPVYSKKIKP